MKSGSQNRCPKVTTVVVGLGLFQILVLMPVEQKLIDVVSFESRQASALESHDNSYFKSTLFKKSLSNHVDFDINTTDLALLYLHVGKTGGMSLDRILRSNCNWRKGKDQRKKCYEALLTGNDELLLSKKTKATLHMELPPAETIRSLCHNQEILWTLRNPISRMVSALDMRANHVYVKNDKTL